MKVLLKIRKITVVDLVFFPCVLCCLYVSDIFTLFFACMQNSLAFFLNNFVAILREFFLATQFRHPFLCDLIRCGLLFFHTFFTFFLTELVRKFMIKFRYKEANKYYNMSTSFELFVGSLAFIWGIYNHEIIREKLRVF